MQRVTWTERFDRAGLVFALAVLLTLAGLIVAQAWRIVERERQYDEEQARRDMCSDLGEWGPDCQD